MLIPAEVLLGAVSKQATAPTPPPLPLVKAVHAQQVAVARQAATPKGAPLLPVMAVAPLKAAKKAL